MAELRLDSVRVPAAALGADSPLPMLTPPAEAHKGATARGVDEEMSRGLTYGRPRSLLPYTAQDAYERDRTPADLRVAVLENDMLRATFLLDVGGRLWSLVHKPTGRELLFRNPVLQPANLALRDAWVAGGVEWNIATTGHCPFTCSPLHAARVTADDGTPVLRLYERERLRGVAFQVDAWLPEGSQVLYVSVRVVNPNGHDVPMYWWSNTAVPESADIRVVAPADRAFHFTYDGRLEVVAPGSWTYPAREPYAADYFFDCDKAPRRWVAALDGSGRGLAQVSTGRLRGRKLFVWGQAPGGRHWQEFLSAPDDAYLEIQAGLARTQLEHVPMPAGARWSWTEAYGLAEAPAEAVHGAWSRARTAVAEAVDRLVSADCLDAAHARAERLADRPPAETLHHGSGWGALERHRRAALRERALDLPGLPFPDVTLGAPQQPWLALLDAGELPAADPATSPASYVTGASWQRLLERARPHWLVLLHLGVVRWAAGDRAAARAAWQRSVDATPNAWALRCLAVADRQDGDNAVAAERHLAAHRLAPSVRQLTVETLHALVEAGRATDALAVVDGVDDAHRRTGRVRLLEARAALAAADLTRASAILDGDLVVPGLREGEDALDDLWAEYRRTRRAAGDPLPDDSLPYRYDFRMR